MRRKRIRGAYWRTLGRLRSLCNISNSSVFKIRLNELNSSEIDTDNDSEFQTEGALMLKAFAENANAIRGTDSNSNYGRICSRL